MSGRSEKKATAGPSSLPASPAGKKPEVKDSRWLVTGICIFLAAIVWVVFGQTLHHEFINYDDDQYVYDNPMVTQGLKLSGVAWAFTTSYSAYWHPLTWLSHMLDCQLWGLNAGDHHLTNVMFHAANALLLFMVLRRMMGLRRDDPQQPYDSLPRNANKTTNTTMAATTPQAGATWPSAFVAALFAIHPLNVESVAWVAERKNVLSTFFWLLTMLFYTRFAQAISVRTGTLNAKSDDKGSGVWGLASGDYWLALGFFALGLMSKPMLVTLPFVLLLLDYWPLGRVTRLHFASARQAGGEWRGTSGKNPGFQPSTKRILRLVFEKVPFLLLAVASSVMTYLGQKSGGAMMTFEQVPLGVRLAKVPVNYVIYLRNTIWPEGLAIPYSCPPAYPVFLVASCTLLLAGVTLLVLWAARTRPYAAVGWFWFLGTLVPVIGLVQVGGTPVADRFTYVPQIGLYLAAAWMIRDWTVAWRYRRQALGLAATLVITALMVCAWKQTSYWRNSETLWRHALACTSGTDTAGNNPDKALPDQGRLVGAIRRFAKALDVTPPNILAQVKLGEALIEQGKIDEGIMVHLNAVLQINPKLAEVHAKIAQALARQGKFRESVNEYDETLRCQPDFAGAINNLAWILATNPDAGLRDGARAVQLAERACEITGRKETIYLGTLAAAYAEAGRFDDAMATAQQACDLAARSGKPDLLTKNQKLLELYRAHKPYRE